MLTRVQKEEVHDRSALGVLQEGEYTGRKDFVHPEPRVVARHLYQGHSKRLVPALAYDVVYQGLDVDGSFTVVAAVHPIKGGREEEVSFLLFSLFFLYLFDLLTF